MPPPRRRGDVAPPSATAATDQPARRRWLAGALGWPLATPWVAPLGVGLAGCSLRPDADHDGAGAPLQAPFGRRFEVAWVLSSGGPRGFVHLGVLKGLEALGLRPSLLVGGSIGAAVATLYAAGLSATTLEAMALDLAPWRFARVAVGGEERMSGAAIAGFVREHTGGRPLEALALPVACVALRLSDRQPVAFNRGDAGLAVQAACAIEGQFAPVRIRGQRHADADLVQPLPVRLARALGAQRVLAVDASAHEHQAPAGSERYREGDLRKRRLTEPDARAADVLLHPEFGYWVSLSREFRERAIAAGEAAVRAQADRIRALHATGG